LLKSETSQRGQRRAPAISVLGDVAGRRMRSCGGGVVIPMSSSVIGQRLWGVRSLAVRRFQDARVILECELWDSLLGMGRSFGDESGFEEYETQCNSCKQCDIFLLDSQFCKSDSKSSAWMEIGD
jgi:hypothetical protein